MKKRFEIEYRTNGLVTQEFYLIEIKCMLEKRGIKITELLNQESELEEKLTNQETEELEEWLEWHDRLSEKINRLLRINKEV